MGQLLPVFLAYLLICLGQQFFREPKEVGDGPLVSSYIFMFAAFLLLWDIRLYPRSLRKLGIVSQCVIEFLIAAFLLENIMVDFWFPLEAVILKAAPNLADLIEEMLKTGEWSCEFICEFLKNETTTLACSYFLSIFFLFAVLHATRAIDIRELENGPACFFGDIIHRTKRYFKRLKRYFGFGLKKRVYIKEGSRDCKPLTASSSGASDMCATTSVPHKNNSSRKCNRKRKKGPSDDDLKYTFSDFEMGLKDDYL